MKKIKLFLIFTLLCNTNLFSQNPVDILSPVILNTTGGFGNDNNNYFEWSIGEESAIETMSSVDYVLTHGILQPISQIPNFNECWGPEEVRIYPNPTSSSTEIHFNSSQTGKISLVLIDASGRNVSSKTFDYFGLGHVEKLDLSRFASGVYFINILLEPSGKSIRKKCAYRVVKLNF